MSDKERRLEYNKRAAEVNAKYQMSRYPGMIQGVEIPAMGEHGGIGIISVTDTVNDSMAPEQRYNPRPGSLLIDGKEVQTPGQQRGLTSIMAPNARNTQKTPDKMAIVPKPRSRSYDLRSLLK